MIEAYTKVFIRRLGDLIKSWRMLVANNRMYLVNKKTGARIYLAKYYPSLGWFMPKGSVERINRAFDDSDFGHLSPEERKAKAEQIGFGRPYANGGMYGCDWHIEYEDTGA